jgi:drug/metabolite transporter (DMT)-like permease
MIYLLLSIFFSTILFIIFKYFHKYQVNNISAIVINYFIAAGLGIMLSDKSELLNIPEKEWLSNAAITGMCFVVTFYMIALTTQKIGISVASVANKMSVVVPIAAAVILYNDSMPTLKIVGIILAIMAVYLSAVKDGKIEIERKYLLLPVALFIANGFIDTYIKYTEYYFLDQNETDLYLTSLFIFAGISGLIYVSIKRINIFTKKDIIAGIILGIPNYASIYFLIKTLELPQFESSVIFPINNMSIVACSALMGIILFKEKLSKTNLVGIFLAIIAISIIAFSS